MNQRNEANDEETILHWLVHCHAIIAGYSGSDARECLPVDLDEADLAELERVERCLLILDDLRNERLEGHDEPACNNSLNTGVTRRIGRFEVESELGRGGAGIVFLAFDPNLCRNVALKVPHPEAMIAPEMQRRFITEAEAAARLDHPNVVSIYDFGHEGPIAYIATEYCSGPNLAQWLRSQITPIAPQDAASIFLAIANGVGHAHSRGVLHRDLKPSNVMLADSEREPLREVSDSNRADVPKFTPKVTDFGLAKLVERKDDATRSGTVLGTTDYMAPEQAEGRVHEIGVPSDVFSIGVMLYEVLCGKHAFRGETEAATLTRLLVSDFTPLQQQRRDLPSDLSAICMMCLEQEQNRRYRSADELANDLSRFLEGKPTKARPISTWERALKWARRRPAWAAVTLLAILGVSAFIFAVLTFNSHLRGALERAERNEAAIRERLYAADMNDAFDAYLASDLQRSRDLLARQSLGDGTASSPGWEWSLLNQMVHQEEREMTQPKAPVFSVAISPNGNLIASGDELSEVNIWKYATGEHLCCFDTKQLEVNTVIFSPDSTLLATAGKDGTVRTWEVDSWKPAGVPLRHGDEVYCVAFSPTGQWIATGGRDNTVRIWELGSSQSTEEWEHPDDIEDLDISASGKFVATGCHDGQVRLWREGAVNEEWRWEPKEDISPISCVRIAPDERQISVCRNRQQIQFLDLSDGHSLLQMDHIPSRVSTCEFMADGVTIVFGCHDGSLHLRRAPSTTLFRATDDVNKIAFTADRDLFAAAGRSGSVTVFDVVLEKVVLSEGRTAGRFPSAAISPDRKTLAYAGIDKTKWDLTTGQRLATGGGEFWQTRQARDLQYSPDGSILAMAVMDGTCSLYAADSFPNGEPLNILEHMIPNKNGDGIVRDNSEITCCDFSPDGSLIATSSCNNLVAIWDVNTGNLLHEFNNHAAPVECVVFSPDGKLLASGDAVGVVLLFDVESRTLLSGTRDHGSEVWTVRFSADGEILYYGGQAGRICALDVQSGLPMGQSISTGTRINWMDWLDESRLLWCGKDWRVGIHRALNFKSDKSVAAHSGKLRAIAIAPDGGDIITSGDDAAIRYWNPATLGTPSYELSLGSREPWDVSLSPDCSRFTTRSEYTKQLDMHDTDDGQLLCTLELSVNEDPVVRWSQDSSYIAVGHGSKVRISASNDGQTVSWLSGHDDDVSDIAFAPNGEIVATASLDQTIRLWLVDDGTLLAILNGHSRSAREVVFSAKGNYIASAGDDRRIIVWKVESGTKAFSLLGHAVPTDLCFSPAGDRIASCADDGIVRIWKLVERIQEHSIVQDGELKCLSFTPDGKTLAVGGYESGIILCHVETGQKLGTLLESNYHVWDTSYDSKGTLTAIGRNDQGKTFLRKWMPGRNFTEPPELVNGRAF